MSLGREAIYSTFFNQITQQLRTPIGYFNYCGRRSVGVGGLSVGQYPAFFLLELGEDYDRTQLFAPAKVILHASGVIHSLVGAVPDETPVTVLNNLADQVEDAVQAACGSTAQNTLSGLVQQAWIAGRQVTIPPSYPNKWAVQIMSIDMVLPNSR